MKLSFSVALIALLAALPSFAQENTDAADVWGVVFEQWQQEQDHHKQRKSDPSWVDRLLHDDFVGWSKDSPAPRTKASVNMWDRFSHTQGRMVQHEIYPLEIVIKDNVAVAHYLFTSAYENKDGEVEMNNGRFTDVLIRTEEGWKFIAWHGGDD